MQVFFHFMQSSYSAFSKDLLEEAKPVWRLKKKKKKKTKTNWMNKTLEFMVNTQAKATLKAIL